VGPPAVRRTQWLGVVRLLLRGAAANTDTDHTAQPNAQSDTSDADNSAHANDDPHFDNDRSHANAGPTTSTRTSFRTG